MESQFENSRYVVLLALNAGGTMVETDALTPSTAADSVLSLPRNEYAMWCQFVSVTPLGLYDVENWPASVDLARQAIGTKARRRHTPEIGQPAGPARRVGGGHLRGSASAEASQKNASERLLLPAGQARGNKMKRTHTWSFVNGEP